jgi:hypothetical protein
MLNSKSDVRYQSSVILRNRALNLDFSEGDEKTFFDLRVQTENSSSTPEVAVSGGESIHFGGEEKAVDVKRKLQRVILGI